MVPDMYIDKAMLKYIQSVARQNTAGDQIQSCLTPDKVRSMICVNEFVRLNITYSILIYRGINERFWESLFHLIQDWVTASNEYSDY